MNALLAFAESRRGSDSYVYMVKPEDIDPARTYRVAATDFMVRVAPGYRELFKEAKGTGIKVRQAVKLWLEQTSPPPQGVASKVKVAGGREPEDPVALSREGSF